MDEELFSPFFNGNLLRSSASASSKLLFENIEVQKSSSIFAEDSSPVSKFAEKKTGDPIKVEPEIEFGTLTGLKSVEAMSPAGGLSSLASEPNVAISKPLKIESSSIKEGDGLSLSTPDKQSRKVIHDSVFPVSIQRKSNNSDCRRPATGTERAPPVHAVIQFESRGISHNDLSRPLEKQVSEDVVLPDGTAVKKDLPTSLNPTSNPVTATILDRCLRSVTQADWLVANSFQGLERRTEEALRDKLRVYCVGPLLPSAYLDPSDPRDSILGTSSRVEMDCAQWLDCKPPVLNVKKPPVLNVPKYHSRAEAERVSVDRWRLTRSLAAASNTDNAMVPSNGRLLHFTISLKEPTMMHNFAITKNYVVVPDQQIVVRPLEIVRGGSPAIYEKQKIPRFGVFPRYDSDETRMKWIEVPDCFCFNFWNAWEDGEEIVVIGSCMTPPDSIFNKSDQPLRSHLSEIRLNTKAGTSSRREIAPLNLEAGQINRNYVGRKTRYAYLSILEPWPKVSGIAKVDLQAKGSPKERITCKLMCEEGCYGGDPFFVPHTTDPSAAEDYGYVLTFMQNETTFSSELLILDARSSSLDIVATVKLSSRVPYGFHGTFLSSDDLANQIDELTKMQMNNGTTGNRATLSRLPYFPYFPPDDRQKFLLVNKVFGHGDVIKLLRDVPAEQRGDAVISMVYEAGQRVRDPVQGCFGVINDLHKQLAELQARLNSTQAQLANMSMQYANLLNLVTEYHEVLATPIYDDSLHEVLVQKYFKSRSFDSG